MAYPVPDPSGAERDARRFRNRLGGTAKPVGRTADGARGEAELTQERVRRTAAEAELDERKAEERERELDQQDEAGRRS